LGADTCASIGGGHLRQYWGQMLAPVLGADACASDNYDRAVTYIAYSIKTVINIPTTIIQIPVIYSQQLLSLHIGWVDLVLFKYILVKPF
jgi:hypothetical protein